MTRIPSSPDQRGSEPDEEDMAQLNDSNLEPGYPADVYSGQESPTQPSHTLSHEM